MSSINKAHQFFIQYPGHLKTSSKEISKRLGISVDDVFEGRKLYRSSNKDNTGTYDEYDVKENHQNHNVNRGYDDKTAMQDQTLEEYCESIGLDPDLIDKYNDVKYWTDASGNRRYSVVPKMQEKEEFKDSVLEAIKQAVPSYTLKAGEFVPTELAGLINIYDAHFDKLSAIGEGYTMEMNMEIVRQAFEKVLGMFKVYTPEVVYFPIGNDLFDTNDFRGTTKKGTPQDLTVHWKDSFQAGITLIREMINALVEEGYIVVVPAIEGNHDADKTFYLNEVIKVAYEDVEEVITTDSSSPRMHFKYGLNMISFGHGAIEKRNVANLPLFAAEEEPAMWGSTKFREMFLGDIHHKEEYRFLRKVDLKGYTVNFLRDITMNHSTWDRNNGYHTGLKTIESHIFHKMEGQIANLKINI